MALNVTKWVIMALIMAHYGTLWLIIAVLAIIVMPAGDYLACLPVLIVP